MLWRLAVRCPNELLLLLTVLVLVCFAFPQLGRIGYVFYSFIALLLTRGRLGRGRGSALDDRIYHSCHRLLHHALCWILSRWWK